MLGNASLFFFVFLVIKIVGGDSTIAATASKCLGYVGADLAALAREAALIAARYASRSTYHRTTVTMQVSQYTIHR